MQTKHLGHWVKSKRIDYTYTGATTPVIDVPAKTLVTKVVFVVTTVFAGGAPAGTVGDGTTPAGWIAGGDLTLTTVGAYVGDETTTANYILGKYYEAADTIDFVESGGACTSGYGYILAHFIPMDEA